jgi:anti-anti-sigma factor
MSGLADVQLEERGAVVIARVTGELDLSGAPAIEHSIGQAVPSSARALVVDFSELDFIDSSGVAMLFSLARRLSGRRQELHVVALEQGPVARVLDIVDFGRAAPVHGDADTALGAVGGAT